MTKHLTRVDGLEVNEVPDGYVIYETARDRVHYLNKTAAIIFELCDGNRDADDIVARVKLLFDLGASDDNEIRGAIKSLLKEGLVSYRTK